MHAILRNRKARLVALFIGLLLLATISLASAAPAGTPIRTLTATPTPTATQ